MKKLLTLLLALVGAAPAGAREEVIHTEKSLYRNIAVTEDQGVRCLKFTTRQRRQPRQSCMQLDAPDHLVLPYTSLMFSGLLVNPQPRRVLLIGLGGGTLADVMAQLFPGVEIDAVEIDPAVVAVARKYFGFEERPGTTVSVSDGRVFVRRALKREERYDYIMLDAFTGDYIPEHLMTREFLEQCRELLTDDGVLVANTFSSSRLYDSESRTYQAAFGWLLNVRRPTGNRIVLTGTVPQPELAALTAAAVRGKADDYARFGIDLSEIAGAVDDRPDWSNRARVLTDQYAPANLLRGSD